MKSILSFINESLFSKKNKCEEIYNWAKDLYNKENEFDDVFSLNKESFTEDKFLKLLKKYWYDNPKNGVVDDSNINVVIYHYLYVKYGYKLTSSHQITDFDVSHFKIEYKDTKNKTIKLPECEINCLYYSPNMNAGQLANIIWSGDIKSVDEYAEMIVNYINKYIK